MTEDHLKESFLLGKPLVDPCEAAKAVIDAKNKEKELLVLIALIGTCNRIPEQHLLDELVEKAKKTVKTLNRN